MERKLNVLNNMGPLPPTIRQPEVPTTINLDDDDDDDPDICIFENMSQPPPKKQCHVDKKSDISGQWSSPSAPTTHNVSNHTRFEKKDEQSVYRASLQDLAQPTSEATPPDGALAVPLMKHQRIALSWMVEKETNNRHCVGGFLADDQGLGKTISTIALILKERSPPSSNGATEVKMEKAETFNSYDVDQVDVTKHDKSNLKIETLIKGTKSRPNAGTLIVCPKCVIRQWYDELHNKVSSKSRLSVLIYHGTKRTKDPIELSKYDVVLTTYSIVSNEVPIKPLTEEDYDEDDDFDFFRPDFSSNKKRKPSKELKKGAEKWILKSSNTINDLYSYFRFLRYDPYAEIQTFRSTIKNLIKRQPEKGYKKLRAILTTMLLRRTKGTFIDGKPIISLPTKTVRMEKLHFTDEERQFYTALEEQSRAQFLEYSNAGTVQQNYANILVMLLRLRQACGHPLLVTGTRSTSELESSLEEAKQLSPEKRKSLLNCLKAFLAICGICGDPPEDAVVTTCEHVFCNQCILERLSSSDCECPSSGCKALLDPSLVFSRSALAQSDSDQNMYDCSSEPLDHCSSNVSVKAEPLGHGSSNVTVKSEPLDYYISNDAVNSSKIEAEMALKSSKIKCAMEYIQSIVKPRETTMEAGSSSSVGSSVVGEKAIVFSQWTKMLDFLEACLIDSSIGFRRLDGTMSIPERDKAVKDFNRLPEVRVMIMSLKAASLGLNMVAANHVLLLDLWWNPTTEEQAIDRAHRICQTRPVKVMRLTVEETVEDRNEEANCGICIWPEAANWAAHVLNRCPTTAVKDKTREEAWSGFKPSVGYFKVFGCIGHVHIPNVNRKKLDNKSFTCVFLGVSQESMAYRMFDPNSKKIMISRDVVFDEEEQWDWEQKRTMNTILKSDDDEEHADPVPNEDVQGHNEDEQHNNESHGGSNNNDSGGSSSSSSSSSRPSTNEFSDASPVQGRIRRQPTYMKDFVSGEGLFDDDDDEVQQLAIFATTNDPANFEEAVKYAKWREAMNLEIEAIKRNETWELVDLPKSAKTIGVKWVFKTKLNEMGEVDKYKARFVAKGYSQQAGIDYTE
ncbi:helicase-like transcription factor CHR28 isoform X2, partial [Tanacetum coccineum]